MFISRNAVIDKSAVLGVNTKVYGFSRIGANSFIDDFVFIGYPTRSKLVNATKLGMVPNFDELIDSLSNGAVIGNNVIIRRSSVIYEDVDLGNEVVLGHNVIIREGTVAKHRCKIGSGTIIDGHVFIDEDTVIQSYVYIPPKVKIGKKVFIAPRVVFTNDRYPPSRKLVETVVEDEVVIGANAVITPGIVIGKGAVVAAGAVVTKSVEPYTVVAGVPAKPIMTRDEYEHKKKIYEEKTIFPYR
jgi:acetyltransferase-like isoleucine patch superfamily enzyme